MTQSPSLQSEQITMLTDLLLSLVAGALAVRVLARLESGADGWFAAWSLAFGFTSAAALMGGLFHGLRYRASPEASRRLWRLTLVLTAGVGFSLMVVAAQVGISPLTHTLLLGAGVVKFAVVLWRLRGSWSFGLVAADSGISLVVLGLVACWGLRAGVLGGEGWWIVGGVTISLLGAAVQQTRVWHGRPFDHNDLFHLVQIVASILFFRGSGQW
ncbi:MAG TPA: hypothetical protein VF167_01105 [Longimicrobiaceae bacterium]